MRDVGGWQAACGCAGDSLDFRPCELHQDAEPCPVCKGVADTIYDEDVKRWIHYECIGEYRYADRGNE